MSGCNECGEFGPASPRCHGGETGDRGGIEVKGELECSPLRAGGAEARGARAGGPGRLRNGGGTAWRHGGTSGRGREVGDDAFAENPLPPLCFLISFFFSVFLFQSFC